MKIRRTIQLAIAIPAVLLGVIALLLAWEVRALLLHADGVRHTEEMKAEIYEAQKLLVDQQSGLRAWLLSGQPEFLAPYTSGAAALPAVLDGLETMAADNASQQARVRELRSYYQVWRAEAETARLRSSTAAATISPQVRDELVQRKRTMDGIRTLTARMIEEEDLLKAHRRSRLVREIRFFALTGAVLVVVFALVSATLIRRWINQLDDTFTRALREQTEARQVAEVVASESLEQSREFERRYLELAARVRQESQA